MLLSLVLIFLMGAILPFAFAPLSIYVFAFIVPAVLLYQWQKSTPWQAFIKGGRIWTGFLWRRSFLGLYQHSYLWQCLRAGSQFNHFVDDPLPDPWPRDPGLSVGAPVRQKKSADPMSRRFSRDVGNLGMAAKLTVKWFSLVISGLYANAHAAARFCTCHRSLWGFTDGRDDLWLRGTDVYPAMAEN